MVGVTTGLLAADGGDAIPLAAALPLGALLLLSGVGILEIARRSAKDLLAPFGSVGVRTSATARSEDAWYAGQRAAAPLLAVAGATSALAGLILFARPSNALAALMIVVAAQVMVAFSLGGCAKGHKAARRTTVSAET